MLTFASGLRWASIILAGFVAGCFETRPLPFDLGAEDGDLAVIVVRDAEDAIVTGRVYRVGTEGAPLTVPDGGEVFGARILRGDLRDPNGAVLDDAALDAITLAYPGSPNSETGACGRCLGAVPYGPQAFYPGDTCAIPPFAVFRADLIAEVAAPDAMAPARLNFPGACACEVPQHDAPSDLSWELVAPAAGWPTQLTAVTSAGLVARISEREASVTSLLGSPSSPTAFVRGPLYGAAAIGPDRFAVARFEQLTGLQDTVVELLDSNLSKIGQVGIEVSRPGLVQLNSELFAAVGAIRPELGGSRVPAAEICGAGSDPSEIVCEALTLGRDERVAGDDAIDAIIASGGDLVVVGTKGLWRFDGIPEPGEGGVTSMDPIGLVNDDSTIIEAAAALNDDLAVFCANVFGDDTVGRPPAAQLLLGAATSTVPFQVSLIHEQPNARCAGFFEKAPVGGVVRALLTEGTVVAVDETGGVISSSTAEALLPADDARVDAHGTESVAVLANGDVYLRDAQGTFQSLPGNRMFASSPAVGLDVANGEPLLVLADGRVQRSGAALLTIMLADAEVLTAALRLSTGALIVAGQDENGSAWWAGLEIAPGPISPQRHPTPSRIVDMKEVGAGTAILLADDGVPLLVNGAALERFVRCPYPATAACGPAATQGLTTLAASGSAAWAAGPQGLFALNAWSSPPSMWRVEIGSVGFQEEIDRIRAVASPCPDLPVLTGARNAAPLERGFVLGLRPTMDMGMPSYFQRQFVDLDRGLAQEAQVDLVWLKGPVSVEVAADNIAVVHPNGVRVGDGIFRPGERLGRVRADGGAGFFMSGISGRLYVGR